MNHHPYLRTYMAGIAVPTAFLLVGLAVFCIARFVCEVPVPIERVIVFPMAIVPNAFGAWNILYVALRSHRHWPIGIHGAILPFIFVPTGYAFATSLGFLTTTPHGFTYFGVVHVPFSFLAVVFPLGVAVYYLVWKYLVGFLNQVVEISG